MNDTTETTNIRVHRSTHRRIKSLKPYDSLSFDEFLNELADVWVRVDEGVLVSDGNGSEPSVDGLGGRNEGGTKR